MNGIEIGTMNLQLFSDESEGVASELVSEPTGDTEPLGNDAERDREDVRKMSSFLRDFQRQAEPDTSQQEPGAEPDNPTEGEPKPQETEPEPSQKPEETPQVIKLPDGREFTPEQILEMEKGHMMQSDYTKKTQALAEERKQLDEQRTAIEKAIKFQQDYERDPIGTAIKLQEEAEKNGIFEPKDPETLALEDRQRELQMKEADLQRKEAEMQQQTVFKDLESRVLALESKHGKDFNRQEVIQFMIDQKIFSPEIAWDAIRAGQVEAKSQKEIDELKARLKKAEEEAVNKYIKSKTVKKDAPLPVGAGGSTGSPPVQVNRPRTLEDAKKAALARPYTP